MSNDQSQVDCNNQKKKTPKYRNTKIYVYKSGFVTSTKDKKLGEVSAVYDSIKEYERHKQLKLLEKAGVIKELVWQKSIQIQEACTNHGEKIQPIIYKADFSYTRAIDGVQVIEDVKGQDRTTGKYLKTKDFSLKWKLLKYKYPDIQFEIF